MVEELGFSNEEAKAHTAIARSYITEPLVLDSRIAGVLYFFSTGPQVFPHAARQSNLTSHAQNLVELLETAAIVSVDRP
jgi:hypothetical protein